MQRVMTIETALELENHFITASKSLKCAYRIMKQIGNFESTCKEVANSAIDAEKAAKQMRQWVTDKIKQCYEQQP